MKLSQSLNYDTMVAAINRIVELDGIDVLFVGPYDLSQSLGIPGQYASRAFREAIDKVGQLDNTLVICAADNGASGEGTPSGSVNENKFFNGYPDELEETMKYIDKLGSPDTYNHYPTGWAMAFSTPYRMFKRYVYQGGIADPLVIHWPKGIQAKGEIRHQYHHVVDIVPTICAVLGVDHKGLSGHSLLEQRSRAE